MVVPNAACVTDGVTATSSVAVVDVEVVVVVVPETAVAILVVVVDHAVVAAVFRYSFHMLLLPSLLLLQLLSVLFCLCCSCFLASAKSFNGFLK